jgi:hypothetical protein
MELQIRRLIDEMEVGIVLLDAGTIIAANSKVPVLMERAAHELVASRLEEVVSPGSLFRLLNWLDSSGHEPVLVLAARGLGESVLLQLKRLASLSYGGRQVQVVSVTEFMAEEEAESPFRLRVV